MGVTTPQSSVLTVIVARPGGSGADLARHTSRAPLTINVIVRNLERGGAIEKTAQAMPGRILRLHAAADGEALPKRCRGRVAKVEAELVGLLGKDEERAFRRA
jgi:DNA-binding MarR family transcriptional regulator